MPQRNSTGFDLKRLSMLLAVLEKRTGLSLRTRDVFVNVTGGLKVMESGGDLGVALAIASSARKMAVSGASAFVGEVGLGGELRNVRGLDLRVKEAARLGFTTAYVPRSSRKIASPGLEVVESGDIEEVLGPCLGG